MIQSILDNYFITSIIVFTSQVAFIYLRTLNVIYTAERRITPTIVTGMGIGLLTLVSFSIGIQSILSGQILPVILFLLGGALGTYWGIKQSIKNENKKEDGRRD